jgi:extradiol dioxygenase family protein
MTNQHNICPFHLAIPVYDLKISRDFYDNVLELPRGRSSEKWTDYNFFGHQLVIHEVTKSTSQIETNSVDGKEVPVPHFGVVLHMEDWQEFAKKLIKKKVSFVIEPYVRFAGQTGEQATMFFYDPCGNALEFKAFKNHDQLFAK